MVMEILTILIPVLVVLFGGNSVLMWLLNRKSNTGQLIKLKNRQAEELVILSEMSLISIDTSERLVDALHEKGVLNGNAADIKRDLGRSRKLMTDYMKKKKNEGLFFKED